MIRGTTKLIAHLGYPTESFKAPMIYNPYFEKPASMRSWCRWGARPRTTRRSCGRVPAHEHPRRADHDAAQGNDGRPARRGLGHGAGSPAPATRCGVRPDGRLLGDMFDGEGFVRGVARKGCELEGARALVVGSGGVGSAIAASLAAGRRGRDRPVRQPRADRRRRLADAPARALSAARRSDRLERSCRLRPGRQRDAARHERRAIRCRWTCRALRPRTFVGEVVMKQEMTAFLARRAGAAAAGSRSAPTCCSSRFPPTSSSSAFRPPRPRSCAHVAQISY